MAKSFNKNTKSSPYFSFIKNLYVITLVVDSIYNFADYISGIKVIQSSNKF